MNKTLAILITTFNRVEETFKCVENISNAALKENYQFKVYIADASNNEIIANRFKGVKSIKVLNIDSDVYWNRGMNFSWKLATLEQDFDFFLWLNNDTYIYDDGIKTIFDDFNQINEDSIIVGITEDENGLTYGGRLNLKGSVLKPSGAPQKVKYINGNFVLISKKVFEKVGYLNNKYSHSLGDIDYGLRSIQKGISLYCTSKFVGQCKANNYIWYNENKLKYRLKALNSPKGTPLNEYIYFNYYHFGFINVIKFLLASFFALLFPKFYKLLRTQ